MRCLAKLAGATHVGARFGGGVAERAHECKSQRDLKAELLLVARGRLRQPGEQSKAPARERDGLLISEDCLSILSCTHKVVGGSAQIPCCLIQEGQLRRNCRTPLRIES